MSTNVRTVILYEQGLFLLRDSIFTYLDSAISRKLKLKALVAKTALKINVTERNKTSEQTWGHKPFKTSSYLVMFQIGH